MSLQKRLQPLPPINGENYKLWLDVLSPEQKTIARNVQGALEALFNGSSYLTDIATKNADWLCEALPQSADVVFAKLIADLEGAGRNSDGMETLSQHLRRTKARVALLAAISETGQTWTSAQSTAALADLADASLQASLDFLMGEAAEKGLLQIPLEQANAAHSGLAIFALGKHGGRELNYSSDIDIVAFYDPNRNILVDPLDADSFYTRVVRNIVKLVDERTEHGYVFRTDLRLRPDPGSTPVAVSTDAALAYYEVRGQNWERAAWIKARACAGDIKVSDDFLGELTPFIWRRHLDFATIADIQAMKRQINVARNVGAARVEGHNVKLGRGGIREIEFFTQTQQLIAGGRDTELRVRPTSKALVALSHAGWITKKAAGELTEAYWFLRAVENRLQMIRDEQTHVMPEDEAGVSVIAKLMGEPDNDAFKTRYRTYLSCVMNYYSELFTEEGSLADDTGDLVFTGTDDDPGTLDTLQSMGFSDASLASATIKKWHYGSYAATRASAARAHLTELLPTLLATISATQNADEALARFDHFLSRFPSGVQLFSLLRNNTHICRTLVAFMASAPRMADAVIHRAHVMDGLIDPAFADGVTSTDVLISKVDDFLDQARSFEDLIDRARIIGQEQKFLIGAGFVSGTVSATRAGEQFSTLAEALLERMFRAVRVEFAENHGEVPGAQAGLLGFGKMASKEMTTTSDLDFILLYDVSDTNEMSDGSRPLAASHYFARLTQRLVAALSAPTAEGVLYEADMRLRPSGNAGPLATNLPGFIAYQKDSAWTWEHLALTRARVIASHNSMKNKINSSIAEILDRPYDRAKIIGEVKSMRARMATERKPRHHFDLKLTAGGLVDIEFVAQSAQLLERKAINDPEASVATILSRLGELGLVPEAERLIEIRQTYLAILQAMSICLSDPFKDESWTRAFKELLAQLTNYPDFQRLEIDLEEMSRDVIAISGKWYETALVSKTSGGA